MEGPLAMVAVSKESKRIVIYYVLNEGALASYLGRVAIGTEQGHLKLKVEAGTS
jgi:hypothetical protein